MAITPNDEDKTWEHLVVFECEMKSPEVFKSKYKNENFTEWLTKFNFGKWKIADIDNFMSGNSIFKESKRREDYKDDIFRDTPLDFRNSIDLRKY